ncbi:MAG: hypothetical protein ABRQ26_13500 [Syntrophomonadaceae bacterium]
MKWGFTRGMQEELLQVEANFKTCLSPWWKEVENYFEQLKDDDTFVMLPALTLSVYRHMGHDLPTSVTLATISKIIYFSNSIHEHIKDDEEGQKPDQDLQFSILIGDYMLGQVLNILVDEQLDILLPMFSSLMAEVNQGLIEKYKMNLDWQEGIEKSRMPIYRIVFASAARLAQAGIKEEERLGSLGYHAGMMVELCKEANCYETARNHAQQAEKIFVMGKCDNVYGDYLYNIVRGFNEVLCTAEQAAAI